MGWPPGSRHSFASLTSALEDRVLRSAGREYSFRPCGPAPALLFRPVNPTKAFRAPPFGSSCFWNGVAARGAFWVCSFQWPDGSVPCGATTAAASPTAPDRSASVAWPSGSGVLSGRLGGGRPRACPYRPPTFFPLCLNRRFARQGCYGWMSLRKPSSGSNPPPRPPSTSTSTGGEPSWRAMAPPRPALGALPALSAGGHLRGAVR